MKKLLYLLLLTPVIYLASCSKSNVTPQENINDKSLEEIIVGKTWKLLNLDEGWFILNNDNTSLAKDYQCDTLEQNAIWQIEDSILSFTYTIGPVEYIERLTIVEYNDSRIKVKIDTSDILEINIIFEIVPEGWGVFGCTDSDAVNYDPLATCDDGSCGVVLDCMGVPNGLAAMDDCGDCHQAYMGQEGFGPFVNIATYADTVGVEGMLFLPGEFDSFWWMETNIPLWNAGCIGCADCFILDLFSTSEFFIGEFCGEDLIAAEQNSYFYNLSEILTSGNDTLQPGYYGANNEDLYDIHCVQHE
ncbi:MAG: hypothetical protein CMD16_02915 [Flavobacteriales bacterium]|nr:hypothetical protein [Flavobacteriales bacterium]|tara:strand:+ start:1392 stop:2300 length:909 start_codon:yes stop_codon:yes gene_type:complete